MQRALVSIAALGAAAALTGGAIRLARGGVPDAVAAAVLLGSGAAVVAAVVALVRGRSAALAAASALRAQIAAQTQELADSNARLRSIIDSAVDGIVVIDARGIVEAFNPGAERLFGYAAGDVIGRNVSMLMPQPYRGEHDGYVGRYLRTGEARIIGVGREVTGQRRDGSTFPLHLSVGVMEVGGERKFTGILHDLTARVALEATLREQTALARLGEMAAVIAHEIKNPLAGIRGAIQVIGGRLPADGRDRAMVGEILSRIDALNALMKDLLLFARPPQPRPIDVDLVPLVASTADLLKHDPALRDVEVEVAGTSSPVRGDPEMLGIVFHNLLVNGAHALQGRGRIRVDVGCRNGACAVAFADSGPGIPPEIRDRLFMPFFTTKSRGSGLGLPTAKRLVEAHQGRIEIQCPPSGGTIVTVVLPAPGSAPAPERSAS